MNGNVLASMLLCLRTLESSSHQNHHKNPVSFCLSITRHLFINPTCAEVFMSCWQNIKAIKVLNLQIKLAGFFFFVKFKKLNKKNQEIRETHTRFLSGSNPALRSPCPLLQTVWQPEVRLEKEKGRGVTKPLKEKNNSERKRAERDLLSGRMWG